MMSDIHEFVELDPTEFHLVPSGATGFPVLLAKAVAEAVDGEMVKACGEPGCDVCLDAVSKKKLKAAERKALPDSDFAIPEDRSYPIPDESHARNALSRVAQYGTPEEKKKVRAAVHRKYPQIDQSDAEKTTESYGASLAQTRAVDAGPGPARRGTAGDGGEPPRLAVEDKRVDVSDGEGDTAPDKNVRRSEAESQTAKAEVDMTGDKAPDDDDSGDVSESQTGKAKSSAADSDPGSHAWEDKDVALGEHAEELVGELEDVVRTFTDREKAEGGDGSAAKAGKRLSGKTEGAIRRIMQACQDLLDNINVPVSKEIEMTNDELMKLLDERDEARRQARKAKKNGKDGKGRTEKAAKGDVKAAKVAKSDAGPESTLTRQIAELQKRLEEVESQDAKRPTVSAAGVSAALRGPNAENAFKAFEDQISTARTPEEASEARRRLAMAKMVAQENARDGRADEARFGPNMHPLFKNTSPAGFLGDDSAVKGI
jgi:myosin heavy subunit